MTTEGFQKVRVFIVSANNRQFQEHYTIPLTKKIYKIESLEDAVISLNNVLPISVNNFR